MKRWILSVAWVLGVVSGTTMAEQTVEETFTPSFSGFAEVRPSYTSQVGSWGTENTLQLMYSPAENVSVGYRQYLLTNIFDSEAGAGEGGLRPEAHDGFLRARFSNLWTSSDGRTTLSYEPRLYLPTFAPRREAGMVVANRNYLTLKRQVSENISLSFTELPILHFYDRPGNVDSDGDVSSNPFFENRLYFAADFKLSQKLSLNLNLMFHQTRRRDNAADTSGDWSFFLWTYPELSYAIDDNFSLGLAYYSANIKIFSTKGRSKPELPAQKPLAPSD